MGLYKTEGELECILWGGSGDVCIHGTQKWRVNQAKLHDVGGNDLRKALLITQHCRIFIFITTLSPP